MILSGTVRRGATVVIAGLLIVSSAFAQQSRLGTIDFPVTGSERARAHFMRGVAALHSFWYEEAIDAFRESTRDDPAFAMGYWGEAMAHNHPLWQEQDLESARKVLKKIDAGFKISDRERAYIEAVRVLYGEGDKNARDAAYTLAMEKIYRAYPEDLEAAAFYALSLLGTVRPGDKGFRRQMQAGATAIGVYEKNPNHPGAAHYIIHAFDDPEHAILALPAARRYAEIAPEAHHARHMPSHIFIQLGMWPEAAASNESSWAASYSWVKNKKLPITLRDYHSFSWLHYIYLQQGRYAKAEELLRQIQADIKEAPQVRQRGYLSMAAAFVIETQRWNLAAKLLSEQDSIGSDQAGQHPQHCAQPKQNQAQTTTPPRRSGRFLIPFVLGFAAAHSGDASVAEKSLTELGAMREEIKQENPYRARLIQILELEIKAVALAHRGDHREAADLMRRATALEEDMSPPSGPPDLIKPSHELFGEILLRAGKAQEASDQFKIALLRQPNRARSLLGLARASAKAGDRQTAVSRYSAFLRIWENADSKLSEFEEARDYLAQAAK
jgi:tetratricopeptide (TPR) repeat protein